MKKYFLIEGMSGGFSDYKKEFDNLEDALKDYIQQGYAANPDCGELYMITESRLGNLNKRILLGNQCVTKKWKNKYL